MDIDLATEPLGTGRQGRAGLSSRTSGPRQSEIQETILKSVQTECSSRNMVKSSKATSTGSSLPVPEGDLYEWDEPSTYVKNPPYFVGMPGRAAPIDADRRRPGSGRARRQHHDRPHLAGRVDQARQSGGQVPVAHGVPVAEFNSYGCPAGQSRGHGARHVRQRPPAQPAGARNRGRLDSTPARRRGHEHLRRVREVPSARVFRSSSWPARNMAPARRATGPPRGRSCWASGP